MVEKQVLLAVVLGWSLALTACGGSGDEPPPATEDPAPGPGSDGGGGGDTDETFSIGGSVAGLTGSGLVIGNNGVDELTLDAAGTFAFAGELGDGDSYAVTIVAQPAGPDNVCTVAHGSGTVDGADVSDIEILCTGPLALTAAAPADDDQDVSRAIEPLLTFSADLDAATLVSGAITLASDAGEVELAFDVSGVQVTLSPDGTLRPLTEYTLTVSTDVLGAGGERMLDPAVVTFRTRDAIWHADVEIDAAPGAANDAQIAFDADGNALAL